MEKENWEDRVVADTGQDIAIAIQALRRAVAREDLELGSNGIGTLLALIVDELLAWA